MLETGKQGWEMQEGTRMDFPSQRPGKQRENSANPPEENDHQHFTFKGEASMKPPCLRLSIHAQEDIEQILTYGH